MATKKKNEMTLEQMLARIDEIGKLLEQDHPLDESLELYNEGVTLIRDAEKLLSSAEKKIRVLTAEDIAEDTSEEEHDA